MCHLPIDRLVIASHNSGKLREIADLLLPYGVTVRSAHELGLPEPAETGQTFAENAAIKARAAAARSGSPALADDSGLEVVALDGAPGIHSARWAGPERDFGRAMEKLRDAMNGVTDRRAAFVCNLCLAWPTGETLAFEGRVEGTVVWPPRGRKGFGYDPIFLPLGEERTFGEMEPDAKHRSSHRAQAFRRLVATLFGEQ